ncbi:MAG: sigma-70 family RNA polymerase sigma factor [Proteobacteria bacterium]|nr:sigma-70 family RNA polymerase sigma factor [Pseudomonadota bacterium]
MSNVSDSDLLDQWRAGDLDAGNRLCLGYFKEIRRFFAGKVAQDVDELVQATFLSCIQSRDKFRGACSFRTFLFMIARRQLYKYFRNNQRHKALDFSVTSLAALDTGPVTYTARNEEHEQLMHALCKLPLEQQLLIELYYWEEMKIADLAEIFGVAQPTVHTRLFRARKALREQIAADAAKSGEITMPPSQQ